MLYLGIRKQQRVNVDAAFKAEQKSSLDGAAATGKR
jgi:hypothetical protein